MKKDFINELKMFEGVGFNTTCDSLKIEYSNDWVEDIYVYWNLNKVHFIIKYDPLMYSYYVSPDIQLNHN